MKCKVDDICQAMDDLSLCALALTEMWHEGNESMKIKKMRSISTSVPEEARGTTDDQDSVDWTNHGGVALVA